MPSQFRKPPAKLGSVAQLDASLVEAAGSVQRHEVSADPHPQYLNQTRADLRYVVAGSGGANGFTAVNPAGVALDGTTDATIALQTELDALAAAGGGTLKLISADGIYLNATATLGSKTTLDFSECPVYFGPFGGIWTEGDLAETPASNNPKLYANISAGDTTFDIVISGANVTPQAGQQFILRGQRNAAGQHLWHETGIIDTATDIGAVSGGERWTIVATQPVDNSYNIRYTGDAFETATSAGDYSTFTIAIYSAFTTDISAGAISADVADGSLFTIGDYVFAHDTETVGNSTSSTDRNGIHNEVNRIVDISGDTITFETPLYHNYTTAYNGGITVMVPTIGTKIIGAKVSYVADGDTKAYAFRFKYSIDCVWEDCELAYSTIAGINYGPYAQGFRIEYSRNCRREFCRYLGKPDAEDYGSGMGYAFVEQGNTDCKSIGCESHNARHALLLQAGAAGNEFSIFHFENSRISDIDFHGINARRNHIHGGSVVGGSLSSPDSTTKTAIKFGNTSHRYGDFGNVVENINIIGYNYSESGSPAGNAIELLARSGYNIARNIYCDGVDYGIKALSNSTDNTALILTHTLENIWLRNVGQKVLNIDGGTNSIVTDLILINVMSDNNAQHFEFSNVNGITIRKCGIVHSIATSGKYAVKITNSAGVKILQNVFDGANRGVSLKQSPGALIISNEFLNQVESRVLNDDTSAGNNNGFIWENNGYGGSTSYTKSLGASTGYIITDRTIDASAVLDMISSTKGSVPCRDTSNWIATGPNTTATKKFLRSVSSGLPSFQEVQVADVAGAAAMAGAGDQAIASTITWDGTPPSSTANIRYAWQQVGAFVFLQMRLEYASAGATNTSVKVDLPSDVPVPFDLTGVDDTEILCAGMGAMYTGLTGTGSSWRVGVYKKSTSATGYTIEGNGASSGSAHGATLSAFYLADTAI